MARSTPERQTLAGRHDPVDSPLQHAHSRQPHATVVPPLL